MSKISISIILSVLLILTGCSSVSMNDNSEIENTSIDSSETQQSETIESESIESNNLSIKDYITAHGIYIGLIDNNSFEVIVDDVPMAFRHPNSPKFIEKNGITENSNVEIVYYVNKDGQNIVKSISPYCDELKVSDYFPITPNVFKEYEGTGIEYASYTSLVEYTSGNQMQIKTNNGGTITVEVYTVTDEEAVKVFQQSEVYDDDNYIGNVNMNDIILKAPLEVGTCWTSNNSQYEITAVGKEISTPYSMFNAIEVTRSTEYSTIYDYYVKDIGHVKSVFIDNESQYEITSSLLSMTVVE